MFEEEEPSLLVDQRGAVRWLTLNRRRHLNAIDTGMIDALMDNLAQAGADPDTRCIVITGARSAFSAGQDLDEVFALESEQGPASIGRMLRDRYAPLVLRLRECPKPIVAAVNGVATGAGLALALGCDIRIASDNASFITAPYRIGLMPAVGLSILLPTILGFSRAMEVCTLHDRIDAETALRFGLVSRVEPNGRFLEAVSEIAQHLADLPARAFAMTKEAFNAAAMPHLRDQLEREVEWQVEAALSPDHLEGLRSFRERRPPKFNGHTAGSAT
jgi:2-(1,2-epoxy-1,2-dihydrophenyl)acetyl-CoA isomerase